MRNKKIALTGISQLSRDFFSLGTLLYAQFFLIYGGSNWFTARRAVRYTLFFEWERNIPFVPQFIYIYLSLSLFVILPLRYLQQWQLRPWAKSYMWMTFVAGALFVLLPTEWAAARPKAVAESQALFTILYALDLPHNLFPSLHVAYTSLAMWIIIGSKRRDGWLWPIIGWWLLMLLSVLLLHQHYLADIAGGLLLASGCYYYVYLAGSHQFNEGNIN